MYQFLVLTSWELGEEESCFTTEKEEKSQLLLHCWYAAEVGCLSREATWATEKLHIPSRASPKLAANLLQAYSQTNMMFRSPYLFLRGELLFILINFVFTVRVHMGLWRFSVHMHIRIPVSNAHIE